MQGRVLSFKVRRQLLYAMLGACFYADTAGTFEIVFDYLQEFYESDTGVPTNPKSALQKYSQNRYGAVPAYSVVSERGPDHDKEFIIEVRIPVGAKNARGRGASKKIAELAAAAALLKLLGVTPQQTHLRQVTRGLRSRPRRMDLGSVDASCLQASE